MKKIFILVLIAFTLFPDSSNACSSAVISGRITPDGRPLLWKNRDTKSLQNSVKYFTSSKFNFIAIVDSEDKNPREIWIGTNNAGFSIMNTLSYNLDKGLNKKGRSRSNGNLMYSALQVCATVKDFQNFLDTTNLKGIGANIGAIDAQGGAIMFEVSSHGYKFFDANDPKVAPSGYIARTNYSFTGKAHEGAGYVRYMTDNQFFETESTKHDITPRWIFEHLSRSFFNPLLGIDLQKGNFNSPATNGWFVDQDFIPRYLSSCSVVIKGVHKGENPDLTTMWTVLGYPPVSIAFPVFVKDASKLLPSLLTSSPDEKTTPIGKKVDTLKKKVFAFHKGEGSERYFNWDKLYNPKGEGIMQKLDLVEQAIFDQTEAVTIKWFQHGKTEEKEMKQLYDRLSLYVNERYKELFGL